MQRIERDVYVPMRDGVHMALDIYRPESAGPWPVVLIRTPYVKQLKESAVPSQLAMLGGDGRPPTVFGWAKVDPVTTAVAAYLDADYAVVLSDSRGTGYSEGDYDYYNIEGGPFDGYDTIEWIAHEPWCDGNVGIWGVSGSAVLAYAAALTSPPHLRAVVSVTHPGDFYLDQWFPGGVFRYEDRIRWPMVMQECIAPLNPGDPTDPNYERKREIFEKRYLGYYQRMTRGLNPVNLDWATEAFTHNTYDDYWERRSFARQFANISAPVLNVGVLHDHFIRGTVTSHELLDVPRRLVVMPGALDIDGTAGDGGVVELQTRWFDHFLRGEDNHVVDESNTRIYLTGAQRWIDSDQWPLPAVDTSLFLANGALAWAPSAADTSVLTHEPAQPNRTPREMADQAFEGGWLTFTTAPLESDLAVVGSPQLSLFAALDSPDVDFCVRLCDVFPDGSSRLLNVGALKASHRVSHERPADLEPGHVYEFDIEILTVSNVFAAGHRIQVAVSASDFPFYASNPVPSRTTICHGGEHSSRLVLPVVAV